MGTFICVIVGIVIGVSVGFAQHERSDVQKRQAQIEKDLAELKELIKEKTNYQDVEV
jgi:uncharacterized membrane-anchored protein YhcB (DUF1043 family)